MTETEIPLLELEVTGAVAGGRCLARHEGKVILVGGALPGERVRARITQEQKRWAEAEAVEIVTANPGRRSPPCPHAADCGGCDFQHAERDVQLAMKRDIVLDAFRRIGGRDVAGLLEGPAAVGEEFRARNRIALSYATTGRPGLRRPSSHDVVAIDGCMQIAGEFDEVILPWLRLQPPCDRATVRISSAGAAVVLFETGERGGSREGRRLAKILRDVPRPESIVGILVDGVPVAGRRELEYVVAGRALRADATSFFQGTSEGARALVDTVNEFLGDDRRGQLLDVFAGVGLFAVLAGRGFEKIVAGEADARAVRYLARNLKKAGLPGEARAEQASYTLAAVPRTDPETVILDPPRTGMAKEVRRALIVRAPRRIVSVSCDVATGARDVGELVREGWQLQRLRAVDLFPTTSHVEVVALLVR